MVLEAVMVGGYVTVQVLELQQRFLAQVLVMDGHGRMVIVLVML